MTFKSLFFKEIIKKIIHEQVQNLYPNPTSLQAYHHHKLKYKDRFHSHLFHEWNHHELSTLLPTFQYYFQFDYFLSCIIVIHTYIQIITSKYNPLLSSNKTTTTNWLITRLKMITYFILFCIIHDYFSWKHTQQDPWFCWMEICTFYTITLL